jgi:predicted nucleic acid-binding protein
MPNTIPKIYADTSVLGGAFDEEFSDASNLLFDAIRAGEFQGVTSEVVRKELVEAPQAVRDLFQEILVSADVAAITEDALRFRDAYQEAGILSSRWSDDALHVALASVAGCDMIVSWNFKHIVHFQKIPLYNAVNTLHGYGTIRIYSPLEVIGYGNPDEDL